MQLRSLGLSSDLALIDGEILDRGSYLVVRSPQEQNYYWGNLLVFAQPPAAGDLQRWESLFASEFEDLPGVKHRTFTWDVANERGDTADFVSAGYRSEHTVVLTASHLKPPPHPNAEIEIRTLHSESDWAELLELQVEFRDEGHEESHFRTYAEGRLRGHRKRIDAGQGEWYGAFLAGRQIANLGIFRSARMARFQIVMTHPEFRRRGVCGTLVHHVAQRALASEETVELVMLADEEYHAARIYESVGFASTEKLVGLCLWPE